jgi:ribosomal protein S18 acetylase RimI-like enzyme
LSSALHHVRVLQPLDLPLVRELIVDAEGVALLPQETNEVLAAALIRNPGASSVALSGSRIIGCCLALHDGLRASFRHLAVAKETRNQGVGRALLEPGFAYFRREGISRVIIQVASDNSGAREFWIKQGFRLSSGLGGKIVSMTRDLL